MTAAMPVHGFLHRLRRNRVAMVGAGFLVLLALLAVFAPFISSHDPNAGSGLRSAFQGPSVEHWFGTDGQGRDVFTRIASGARIALVSGVEAVAIGLAIGVPIGLLIGYRGGRLDAVLMRFVEAVVAVPAVVLAMALIAVLGGGIAKAMVAVGFVFAMAVIRLTRATVLAERNTTYVAGAQVVGSSGRRVMWRHILPNVAGVLIVQATLLFAATIVFEAGLSLIGLGASSDQPSWGVMLRSSSQQLVRHPMQPTAPALVIFLTVLAINALGDGLRDAFGRTAPEAIFEGRAERIASPAKPEDAPASSVLSIRELSVTFPSAGGDRVPAVDGVSFDVAEGEVFALVGESGSGKTLTALSVMGLVAPPGQVAAASIRLGSRELTGLGFDDLRPLRGPQVAMIFQEPSAALNPVFTVGNQLMEPLRAHLGMSRKAARDRSVELLERVGITNAVARLDDYPHQFSGGMAQRVMIAMALSCSPKLIIADEPTTALDVTVQGQVLDLLAELQDELGMAVLLITHDLGVVADLADRVAVMYAGQIVESGAADLVLANPEHPYTRGLLQAAPVNERRVGRLPTLPGAVPSPGAWGAGCRFASRCPDVATRCTTAAVDLRSDATASRRIRCVMVETVCEETARPLDRARS